MGSEKSVGLYLRYGDNIPYPSLPLTPLTLELMTMSRPFPGSHLYEVRKVLQDHGFRIGIDIWNTSRPTLDVYQHTDTNPNPYHDRDSVGIFGYREHLDYIRRILPWLTELAYQDPEPWTLKLDEPVFLTVLPWRKP